MFTLRISICLFTSERGISSEHCLTLMLLHKSLITLLIVLILNAVMNWGIWRKKQLLFTVWSLHFLLIIYVIHHNNPTNINILYLVIFLIKCFIFYKQNTCMLMNINPLGKTNMNSKYFTGSFYFEIHVFLYESSSIL